MGPLNTDSRLIDPPPPKSADETTNVDATLGWIAGGMIVLMFLLVLVFGSISSTSHNSGVDRQHAQQGRLPPPATTGQGAH